MSVRTMNGENIFVIILLRFLHLDPSTASTSELLLREEDRKYRMLTLLFFSAKILSSPKDHFGLLC